MRIPSGVEARRATFRKTHHGPVVAEHEGRPVALRLAKLDEGGWFDQWLAMAKAGGRDRVEVFDDELRRRGARRVEVERALRRALEGDGLALRFEPVADLADPLVPRIVGAEASVRLDLDDGEVVGMGELLAVAQECGLSGALTAQALDGACRAARAWSVSATYTELSWPRASPVGPSRAGSALSVRVPPVRGLTVVIIPRVSICRRLAANQGEIRKLPFVRTTTSLG